MSRDTRYQGAIIRDDHILLIKHREHASGCSYWVVPGGGRELNETEEECVQREMREETRLDVTVTRLVLDEAGHEGGFYERMKTYLCQVSSGEAAPGYEPEEEAAQSYAITEVAWFDLRKPEAWAVDLTSDPITFPFLTRIRKVLGYSE